MIENNIVKASPGTQIENLIYVIRDKQVMLDSDLAELYQVETKQLTRQMRRNIDRFPEDFCFQLSKEEFENLRCQIGTSNSEGNYGGRRYSPYVFTEQGISMLSAVLRSDVATKVSIKIMRAFVEMRKFLVSNRELFSRLDRTELRQLEYKKETDEKFNKLFNYIASSEEVTQKIFFNGQIYDAFRLLVDIVKKANTKIILIDNYADTDTLNILCKRKDGVKIEIYTAGKGALTKQDIAKFNSQYKNLTIESTNSFHDRFIILDDNITYHIGASLKDAGKKSFGINRLEDNKLTLELINRIESEKSKK